MFEDFYECHLQPVPVIGIFRGFAPHETAALCRRAWDSGVSLVEIPVQSPDAMPSLRAAITAAEEAGSATQVVGAGTVTTRERLDAVLAEGARFVVTPGLHPEVVDECIARGVPVLPGVATSTEVAHAVASGLTWLKAFPAGQLTPGWVSAQLGPFPGVHFVATGGVAASNARQFLDAGCSAVAVGAAFGSEATITELIDAL